MASVLDEVQQLGQSIWLDELNRELLRSGQLARLIDHVGLSGVFGNLGSQGAGGWDASDRADMRRLHASGATAEQICEQLLLQDARDAADQLHRIYRRSTHRDGFVSLELSPLLAANTLETVQEAIRMWRAVDRPNAMIKVPATREGLPALQQLIGEGINVNATLLFGVSRYREVLDAFAAGLEQRRGAGGNIEQIASVASVYVSPIDRLIDDRLSKIRDPACLGRARRLMGQAGTQVARFAYQDFKKFLASPRWQVLATYGASPQRLLWASTDTANPALGDVKYPDALIGRGTVMTLSLATMAAFRDHGRPALNLETDLYDAAALPSDLLSLGIDLEQLSQQLQTEALGKAAESSKALIADISAICRLVE
jgi:transaldolase